MIEDTHLATMLGEASRRAVDYHSSEIGKAQQKALEYYEGAEMPGDADRKEDDGLSRVVSRDVAEVIDWSLPELVRMFVGKDKIAEFLPKRQGDEAIAEQATTYLNHLFMYENDGFNIVHDQLQDGLLQVVGVVRVYWDEGGTPERETFEGLTLAAATNIHADPDIRVLEWGWEDDGQETLWARTETIPKGRVRVDPVPPDCFLIAPGTRDPDEASYIGMRARKTVSDLIADGFAREEVERLSDGDAGAAEIDMNDRYALEGGLDGDFAKQGATRQVTVYDEYARIDVDGDGVAELIHAIRVGDTILHWEEVREQEFCIFCPNRRAHRVFGRSMAQDAFEIQEVKTALLRDALNNTALANAPQRYVNEGSITENTIGDLLDVRPGGIVRARGAMGEAFGNLTVPNMAGAALQLIEYTDSAAERRTGVSRYNQGLDGESLNKTATGVSLTLEAGQARRDLVARLYEQTLEAIFRKALRLVVRHQDKPDTVWSGKEWLTFDPAEWRDDLGVSVKVGARAASKAQRRAEALELLQVQRDAAQAGMATPENIMEGLRRLVDTFEFGPVDDFFGLPQQEAQGPSPEQQQAMADLQMKQAEMEMKREEIAARLSLEREKASADIAMKREEMAIQRELKLAEIAVRGSTNENIRSPV